MKWRIRQSAVLIMLIILFSADINVYAQDVADTGSEELTAEEQAEKQFQEELDRVYEMASQSNQLADWPEGPATYGEASIVMDMESGAILYAKNIDEQLYPASITKLATALIAMENGNLEDKVTVTNDCISFLQSDEAQIGLQEGEELTLKETLYATLLASANEAAYAVAANVGESYDWFISAMNEQAKELGAKNTHFVNPNGLHDDEHYTTARDMALISSELYNYPEVFEIMQTLEHQIPATNKVNEVRYVQQNHSMLYPDSDYYNQYVIGGKTGYTDQSQTTLVTFADNGDLHLVCVELKTYGKIVYEDTANMLNYAFDNFSKVPIMDNDQSGYLESAEDEAYVVLPKTVSFADLEMEITENEEKSGQGTVSYTYEGQPVGSAEVTLSEAYLNPEPEETVTPKAESGSAEGESEPEYKKVFIALLISAVMIVVIFTVFLLRRARRIKRQKRSRRRRRKP